MNLKLLIWVTSECNLRCPLCNQKNAMRLNPGYHMDIKEVNYIVDSCKKRNIRFSVIELVGGEMSLWCNLEYGIKRFKEIADDIFIVTNGTNAERVINSGLPHWIISTSQCTKKQLAKFKGHFDKIIFNSHSHKPVPVYSIDDTLPANCVVARSPFDPSIMENGMFYYMGKVYYCQLVISCSDRVPITDNLVCDFESNFIKKFSNKKFDIKQCQYCLCNSKVFSKL